MTPRTPQRPPSDTLLLAIIAGRFTPADLRHLATSLELAGVAQRNRRALSPDAIDELVTMVEERRTPTVGWWRAVRGAAHPEGQVAADG